MDLHLHRPAAVRCHRRPAHLRRPHHPDRHRLLPAAHHQDPPQQRRNLRSPRPPTEVPSMSYPPGDYLIAEITLDPSRTREIIHLLTDVHSALDHLYLAAPHPDTTTPAHAYLPDPPPPP